MLNIALDFLLLWVILGTWFLFLSFGMELAAALKNLGHTSNAPKSGKQPNILAWLIKWFLIWPMFATDILVAWIKGKSLHDHLTDLEEAAEEAIKAEKAAMERRILEAPCMWGMFRHNKRTYWMLERKFRPEEPLFTHVVIQSDDPSLPILVQRVTNDGDVVATFKSGFPSDVEAAKNECIRDLAWVNKVLHGKKPRKRKAK
jgi:hypothetical protein